MHAALEPTQQPDWVLSHEGYNVLSERRCRIPLRLRQRILGHACRSLGQPGPYLGGVAWIHQMGLLAALLRRRPFRHAQHRAAGARTGARRRLVAGAHPTGRRAAAGTRGRSAPRHPQARPAPWLAVVGLDASHPCRHHSNRAGDASSVACGPRGRAPTHVSFARPRWRRREVGSQFRAGRAWHGADATGAGPRRLAYRGRG